MPVLSELHDKLNSDIQPSNTSLRLNTDQLNRSILQALRDFNPSKDIETLTEVEKEVVLLGAAANCYWLLASKCAEGYQTEIDTDKFFLQQMFEHYMNLADKFQKRFSAELSKLGVSDGLEIGTFSVIDATRRSLSNGKLVPPPED